MAKSKTTQKTKMKSKPRSNHSIETLHDAFIHELSDMKNAEIQLTKALPKLAKAASDPQLSKAFQSHLKETEGQIKLIDRAVKSAGITLKREKCDAMEGLVREGQEIIKSVGEGPVRDVLLIAAAQKVEHYEIASYGCLIAAAKQLGFAEAANYLDQILDQEKRADEKLNQLAEHGINEEAAMQDQTQEGTTMPRYGRQQSNAGRQRQGQGRMTSRDEEGRFMSNDDRGYGRGQSYSDDRSSGYDQDYDDRRYSRSSREDDYEYDDGYATSADDYDDDREYSAGGNDYDDDYSDDRSYSRRGQSGRSDDMEGHSQSARQRGRSHMRSSSRDDRYYDDNRSSAGSRDQDHRGRSAGSSSRSRSASHSTGRGWFGDPEGHARAGRHSHDNYRSSGRR